MNSNKDRKPREEQTGVFEYVAARDYEPTEEVDFQAVLSEARESGRILSDNTYTNDRFAMRVVVFNDEETDSKYAQRGFLVFTRDISAGETELKPYKHFKEMQTGKILENLYSALERATHEHDLREVSYRFFTVAGKDSLSSKNIGNYLELGPRSRQIRAIAEKKAQQAKDALE